MKPRPTSATKRYRQKLFNSSDLFIQFWTDLLHGKSNTSVLQDVWEKQLIFFKMHI